MKDLWALLDLDNEERDVLWDNGIDPDALIAALWEIQTLREAHE